MRVSALSRAAECFVEVRLAKGTALGASCAASWGKATLTLQSVLFGRSVLPAVTIEVEVRIICLRICQTLDLNCLILEQETG